MKWTEPGLSPEERAGALLEDTDMPTADEITAAIRAAVEEERRRCEGVARARAEVFLTAASKGRTSAERHLAIQRREVANDIATRISGEGETR